MAPGRKCRDSDIINYFRVNPDASYIQCSRDIHVSPTTITKVMKRFKEGISKSDVEFIIDELNKTIKEVKDKDAYLIFFYPGSPELVPHSVTFDQIEQLEPVPGSTRFIRIRYKNNDNAFIRIESIYEIYACVHPENDVPKMEKKENGQGHYS